MKLTFEYPAPYYAKETCIYYLTKTVSNKRTPFYVGKTVNPSGRLSRHRETFGDKVEMFVYKVVPDKEWKKAEIQAIEKFKKAGYTLENKHKGGGGAERGLTFNLERYVERWSNDHNVIVPDGIKDNVKTIFKKLRKDNVSNPYKYLDSFLLSIVAYDRYKYYEDLNIQTMDIHLKDMREIYPKYTVSFG